MILSITLALVLLLILSLFAGSALYLASAAAPHPQAVIPPILSIIKSVNNQSVMPGESLMYTLTVANTSATSSTVGLFVTDTVPANTSFESASFPVGSVIIAMPNVGGTGVVTWTPSAQLAPSETLQFLLKVKVASGLPAGTVITNFEYGAGEAQFGSVPGSPVTTSVIAVPSIPTSMTLRVMPASVPVASTSALTATAYDQFKQPMAGQVVGFSTVDDLGWGGAIVPASASTGSGGQASAVISSTLPGVKRVTATVGSLTASASVTFTVSAGEPYTIAMAANPTSVRITETTRVVATITDQMGNRLSGRIVAFSSSSSFGTAMFSAISPLTGTTDANGQVTTTVSSLFPGDKLIVATAPNGVTGQVHVNFQGMNLIYLPVSMNYYRIAPACAPQVWYTFPSAGGSPRGMAYDPVGGRLFVANRDNDTNNLTVLNAISGQLIRGVGGLLSAHGVAFDAARNRIYVAGGSTLYIVDGVTYGVLQTVALDGLYAQTIAYNPTADKIYVGFRDSPSVAIVNAVTWQIITTLTGESNFHEVSGIAVNPVTNKVYVSNKKIGGWVTVISGVTDQVITTIPTSGDLTGITVDTVHNRVYAAAMSAASVYQVDGSTDTLHPDRIEIRRSIDNRLVPVRHVAVNPNAGAGVHLWVLASGSDDGTWGMDQLILLAGDWPDMGQPRATPVARTFESGLLFEPASWKVFATSSFQNQVTVSQDSNTLCPTPLSVKTNRVNPYYTVMSNDND